MVSFHLLMDFPDFYFVSKVSNLSQFFEWNLVLQRADLYIPDTLLWINYLMNNLPLHFIFPYQKEHRHCYIIEIHQSHRCQNCIPNESLICPLRDKEIIEVKNKHLDIANFELEELEEILTHNALLRWLTLSSSSLSEVFSGILLFFKTNMELSIYST